jgi:hypothetical protein
LIPPHHVCHLAHTGKLAGGRLFLRDR